MAPEDVLARVRKLLALAGSPNVHEAASAAAAAQALLERHRLTGWLEEENARVAAYDAIGDGAAEPLEVSRRLRRWKLALASGLARCNGCVAYTVDGARGEELRVAGRDEDRAAVRALWDGLVRQLEWLSATHGAGRPRAWHEAFRVGAAEVIVARLGAQGALPPEDVPEAAIARVDARRAARDAALTGWMERHLWAGPGKGMRVDARGFAAGRAVGGDVSLPTSSEGTVTRRTGGG